MEARPEQNGPPGRAHGLVILPSLLHVRRTPRSSLLSEWPNKVLEGHINYKVVHVYGQPVDEELYDRWVVSLHKPELQADLDQHEGLMELFDRAVTFAERW
eukprot:6200245-Pleurochrysis_carterae.AAC.1